MPLSKYFGTTVDIADLNRRSVRGGAVAVAGQATSMTVQLVSMILIARALPPEDFGLVAIVLAAFGFANLVVDLGTRDTVTQREDLSQEEVSALFWLTVALGLVLTFLALLVAPLLARLYGDPRLTAIGIALSLTFVLPTLSFQHYALMRRALMFRQLAIVEIVGNVLSSAVAIALAYSGWGYWSLVAKPLLWPVVLALGVWYHCPWRPGRWRFDSNVKEIVKFGANLTGFTLLDYGARAADRVALGYTAGPHALGFYQNASVIFDNAMTLFTGPLHGIAVASLSKLRKDSRALKEGWANAVSTIAFFAAPAFVILSVVATDLVVTLLGAKWMEAGALLSVLALRGPPQVAERSLGWLHVALGRADRLRRWGIFGSFALFLALLAGLPFGPLGVAIAYSTLSYATVVPAIVYAGAPVALRARDVLRAIGPPILCATACGALGLYLKEDVFVALPPHARLLIVPFLCVTAYLLLMRFAFRETRALRTVLAMARPRRESV